MNNRKCILFLLLVLFSLSSESIFAQKNEALPQPDNSDFFGTVSDGVYRNLFFGFELSVPKGWFLLSEEQKSAAKDVGLEGLKGENTRTNAAIEKAAQAEVVVLAYSKRPLGSIENSAIAFGVGKQRSKHITPEMVVEGAKSLLLKNPKSKLIQDTRVETIGGKRFASMVLDLELNGPVIRLKYFATMVREYSLTVSMSINDADALVTMESSLSTIRFASK